jgi:hypothetical protein
MVVRPSVTGSGIIVQRGSKKEDLLAGRSNLAIILQSVKGLGRVDEVGAAGADRQWLKNL